MSRTQRWCTLIVLAGVATSSSAGRNVAAADSGPVQPPTVQSRCNNPSANIPLTGRTCGPVQDLQLSCYVPSDIVSPSAAPSPNFNTTQRSADIFSWQEFLAINWPARTGVRGEPDPDKKIGDAGPRLWETWKEEYEVYRANGIAPLPWDAPEALPGPSRTGGSAKVFYRTQKIHDVVDSTLQAAASNGTLPATLTDQKGQLVRYEIRLNKVMFDYIVANQLYDAHMQTVAPAVSFPDGGILIKAAWRDVTPDEESSFHTVAASVCDKQTNGTLANCRMKRMGLVGLHITQKTPSSPQWIWSTFEHVKNVPGDAVGGPFSFNAPGCLNCSPNQQTRRGVPNQIVRTIPIPSVDPNCNEPGKAVDNIRLLNQDVQQPLRQAGSVFQHYELINTQWPVPPTSAKPSTAFAVLLPALANTTMESFVQPTSSCMGCHATARTVNPNAFVSSDFSFTLNNAQPPLRSCKIIPSPEKPVTSFDRQNWTAITRGYALATKTYELLPKSVPTAKLHCASCHLSAGANSDAAWWVDMKSEYPTKPLLQARINHCFTNSLNGNELCTPAGKTGQGNCDANPDMNAFTTYIQWLDEQAAAIGLCNSVPNGFPPIANLTGNAPNGEKIFAQKCAVCHRPDGAGRYESNTYFRPALWGPTSFNQAAGMFSYPSSLAAFLRWNMPLMAGGELSDREAWDLEAFLHSQDRPVKPVREIVTSK